MEDLINAEKYMETRCPSWCDRVFLNDSMKDLINLNSDSILTYEMIGEKSCMGDHKVKI